MSKYSEELHALIKGETALEMPVKLKAGGHDHSATSFSSMRRGVHRGRKISVRTSYRIEIDGEPIHVHTMVTDDGQVRCHGLPNYSFSSALDLARALVDASMRAAIPEDELNGAAEPDHPHDPHHHWGSGS